MTKGKPWPIHRDQVPRDLFPPRKCGDVTGRLNAKGMPCGRQCVPGAKGCLKHGGGTPQSVAMVLRNVDKGLIRSRAEQIVDYAESRGKRPEDILMDSVWRLDALKDAMGVLVVETADENGGPVPAIVREYALALVEAAKTAKIAIDKNLDEKKFRLSVAQSDMRRVLECIQASAQDARLGLDIQQQTLFISILSENLIEGGLV